MTEPFRRSIASESEKQYNLYEIYNLKILSKEYPLYNYIQRKNDCRNKTEICVKNKADYIRKRGIRRYSKRCHFGDCYGNGSSEYTD